MPHPEILVDIAIQSLHGIVQLYVSHLSGGTALQGLTQICDLVVLILIRINVHASATQSSTLRSDGSWDEKSRYLR